MNTLRTRIARLTATSALVLGLGALAAGPASASYNSWAGSVPTDRLTLVAGDDAGPQGLGKPGGVSVVILADDASPESIGRGSGVKSVVTAGDDAGTDGIGRGSGITSA